MNCVSLRDTFHGNDHITPAVGGTFEDDFFLFPTWDVLLVVSWRVFQLLTRGTNFRNGSFLAAGGYRFVEEMMH